VKLSGFDRIQSFNYVRRSPLNLTGFKINQQNSDLTRSDFSLSSEFLNAGQESDGQQIKGWVEAGARLAGKQHR
jgi:hypothetical protein